MKKAFIFIISALIIIISGIFTFSSALLAAEYVRGEVLVKFKASARTAEIENLHSHAGAVRKKQFKKMKIQQVRLPDQMSVLEAVAYYSSDRNVEYAEPNYIVHATAVPDDPSFSELWGLHNIEQSVNGTAGTADADIDAPEAWEVTTGLTDVIIAVIDSGMAYSHPDFYDPIDPASNNVWLNTGEDDIQGNCGNGVDDNGNGFIDDCAECANGTDDDGNGYVDDCRGWDFIGDDNDPNDYNDGIGHGTHVAGTIAAYGNNGTAVTGVMWRAKIMPLRFLGISGSGSIADAISAILYANEKGAHVINNSWGGGGFSQALKDAIDASAAVIVCAAGNDGTDNDAVPHYPAGYNSSNIIAVAATDSSDNPAYFSNYGLTSVDVAAPGVNIYSSVPLHTYGTAVNLYGNENFDSSAGALPAAPADLLGWSRGGTNSTWEITAGTGVSGTNSLEDSPGGNYIEDTVSWAGYMTPIPSVKDSIYTLAFQWKGAFEENYDYLDINFSVDKANWYWIDYRTGNTSGQFISDSTTELTIIAEQTGSFYFGFGITSDESFVDSGVYIDNVALSRKPILIDSYTYNYLQGTSMAAPHVSGVAGLVKSLNAEFTGPDIKAAIINSVDVKSSLSGKVLTGGRVNAHKALRYALEPYAPSELTVVPVSDSQIHLSWKDNSTNEAGFQIERKTGSDGTFSAIDSVGTNVTSYDDTGLQPSTSYYYRVRAYGTSLGNFAYSEQEDATTSALSADISSGGGGGGGGGCFIATAAYGSIMHPYVKKLREFRDTQLLTNYTGRVFVDLYYEYSPPLADIIRRSDCLRTLTRIMLSPLVLTVVFPLESAGLLITGICISARVLRKRKEALSS